MTDKELYIEYRKGEVSAFGKIYEKYFSDLYNFIYFRILSEELAEKILENTFLSLLLKLENCNIEIEGSLKDIIYNISIENIELELKNLITNNPKVEINSKKDKSLKNKLEITSYTKIRNTKNKRINIAKKGFLSFKKDNLDIFEKPKTNYKKIFLFIFILIFISISCFLIYYFNLNILEYFNELYVNEDNISM